MTKGEELLLEFREELKTTRRVLERVPADKLSWKPHEKSMSLGSLSLHIARLPGGIISITRNDIFDVVKSNPQPSAAKSMDEVFAALEWSANEVETTLKTATDEMAFAPWRMVRGEQTILAIPRFMAWRSMLLNHWYHHRGQLSVYLRLLDVPVPSVYGPSADERAFG